LAPEVVKAVRSIEAYFDKYSGQSTPTKRKRSRDDFESEEDIESHPQSFDQLPVYDSQPTLSATDIPLYSTDGTTFEIPLYPYPLAAPSYTESPSCYSNVDFFEGMDWSHFGSINQLCMA